jgi:hypothetical protein
MKVSRQDINGFNSHILTLCRMASALKQAFAQFESWFRVMRFMFTPFVADVVATRHNES